jgi:U3 small nucleolar RNA-associated protein 10
VQVLMATRSDAAGVRSRALQVVQGLVERVREDYLMQIPETLPFLSELLEDPEAHIVACTQTLLKLLEDLAGEDLGQFLKA